MVLNSFRCCAIDAFSAIFKLNSFFIRCTLLFADGFSYIPDKAFIRSAVVFSFTTLCVTDLDRINLITPSTCLLRRAHSSAFHSIKICPPKRQMQFPLIEIIFNLHPPICKVCAIKLFYSRQLSCFLCHCSHSNLTLGSDTSCRELIRIPNL